MQKFERFIVYPLLFVALFYAMTGGAGTDTLANPLDSEIEDTVRTRDLQIYNDDNEMVGGFRSSDNGGGALAIFNNQGNIKVGLGSTSDDSGVLDIFNSENNKIVGLGMALDSDKTGIIEVYNKNGDLLNVISSSVNGKHGAINILNERGDTLVGIGSDNNYHGLINVYDKYGEDWKSYSFR